MAAKWDGLPANYQERMTQMLGPEIDAFTKSFEQDSVAGIRLNPSKIKKEELPFALEPVPWAKDGYYSGQDAPISRHPFYFAGCYYIQEPSAMLPAECLSASPGEMVLDLCAAPGGKATQLAAGLKGRGLLLANDASASRANALLKNLTLWGSPNSCVSAETPERLEELCGCCFDKILVDAPCSGEGMFRKDPAMASSWQEKGPSYYAKRQRKILSCAVRMLKPGGILAYSTCTFSREENEDVVSLALDQFPELSLISPESCDGFAPGIGGYPLEKCVRLYPHRVRGEGHFLALMKKSPEAVPGDAGIYPLAVDEENQEEEKMPDEVSSFLSRLPKSFLASYRFKMMKDECLLIPPYHLLNLRYLRTGVRIGRWKSGRFEPSQDLAMLLNAEDFDAPLHLDPADDRVIRYLKGETISLSQRELLDLEDSKGCWVLVCAGGHALGWGKISGGNLKNKLYPGWRYR